MELAVRIVWGRGSQGWGGRPVTGDTFQQLKVLQDLYCATPWLAESPQCQPAGARLNLKVFTRTSAALAPSLFPLPFTGCAICQRSLQLCHSKEAAPRQLRNKGKGAHLASSLHGRINWGPSPSYPYSKSSADASYYLELFT